MSAVKVAALKPLPTAPVSALSSGVAKAAGALVADCAMPTTARMAIAAMHRNTKGVVRRVIFGVPPKFPSQYLVSPCPDDGVCLSKKGRNLQGTNWMCSRAVRIRKCRERGEKIISSTAFLSIPLIGNEDHYHMQL